MHCFWLLEFKFAFEFKCLIFSLNLSKFRSLEKAPDLSLLEAQPSSRGPSAKVRWKPSDSPAWFASSPSLGPAAAQLSPVIPRRPAPRRFPRSLSLTGGAHLSSPSSRSSPSRTQVRPRVPAGRDPRRVRLGWLGPHAKELPGSI